MSTHAKNTPAKTTAALPTLHPNAAGIDIGATAIYVGVPQDRATPCVRRFETFTQDLLSAADWLAECGVQTIAIESTGVYWIALYQILEARGFEVCLVNARHLKNVPGHKSDVDDCQWLQYVHACGLLRASFRPDEQICAVRSLLRHRETLVAYAASHVQQMQKALIQMNLLLHNVISDLTGKTGLAILDAILAGERDPKALAALKDFRIKASLETIAKSLQGYYRPEHLFTLKQALAAYRHYQQLIGECDQELEKLLVDLDGRIDPTQHPLPSPTPKQKPSGGNAVQFAETDLRRELYRILGVDLTEVPGFGTLSIHTLLAEIGPDLSAFPTDKHFSSWLGLCPDNRISGDKVLSSHTRKGANRAANVFRMAAQSLWHSRSHLGDHYRKMRARLGPRAANTATAHKLARIFYHLLTTGESYDESVFAQEQERQRQRREQRLRKEAIALGFQLVPQTSGV
jgi:transposase